MTQQTDRERNALARALEMLGFDAERLAAELLKGGTAEYWASLALDASRVTFDPERAQALEPGLSPVALAAVESWWLEARPDEPGASLTFLPAREYDHRAAFDRLRLSPGEVSRITVTQGVSGGAR